MNISQKFLKDNVKLLISYINMVSFNELKKEKLIYDIYKNVIKQQPIYFLSECIKNNLTKNKKNINLLNYLIENKEHIINNIQKNNYSEDLYFDFKKEKLPFSFIETSLYYDYINIYCLFNFTNDKKKNREILENFLEKNKILQNFDFFFNISLLNENFINLIDKKTFINPIVEDLKSINHIYENNIDLFNFNYENSKKSINNISDNVIRVLQYQQDMVETSCLSLLNNKLKFENIITNLINFKNNFPQIQIDIFIKNSIIQVLSNLKENNDIENFIKKYEDIKILKKSNLLLKEEVLIIEKKEKEVAEFLFKRYFTNIFIYKNTNNKNIINDLEKLFKIIYDKDIKIDKKNLDLQIKSYENYSNELIGEYQNIEIIKEQQLLFINTQFEKLLLLNNFSSKFLNKNQKSFKI